MVSVRFWSGVGYGGIVLARLARLVVDSTAYSLLEVRGLPLSLGFISDC